MENKIDSVVVLSTYFGNRCKYPMDVNSALYVLYDVLNHYISFDFGIPCDIVVVDHDVTTLNNFDKEINENTKKIVYKSKELLDKFNDQKLLNGGKIKILHRNWNNGGGMAMASFNYVFEQFRNEYFYWFFNEDDVKIMKCGHFKDLIGILNSDDKIALASIWRDSPLGVSNTFYLNKMYNKFGKLLGTYIELSKEAQIRSIQKVEYFDWNDGELGNKRRIEGDLGQNGWNSFFNSIGYRIERSNDEFHHNCILYYRVNHTINKNQTPRIIVNEKDELILINADGKEEKIEKWIK